MMMSRIVLKRSVPRMMASRTFAASTEGLEHTALFDLHRDLGGDMVPFAGYALPVLYKDWGVMKEHLWCREKASLFDVSHMGQVRIVSIACFHHVTQTKPSFSCH